MIQVIQIEEFAKSPIGKSCVGRSYVVWRASAALGGLSLWGSPGEAELRAFLDLWHLGGPFPLRERSLDAITDCTALSKIEPHLLPVFVDALRNRAPDFRTAYRRHAVIVPRGVLGATLAGVFALAEPRHPWQIFEARGAALSWLAAVESAPFLDEIDAVVAEHARIPTVLRSLQEHISSELTSATLRSAAAALLIPPRRLQRELHMAGTSFREELVRARIREAQRLMGDTELTLARIAERIGCSSQPSFSRMFRRVVGASPRQHRRITQ